MPDHFTIDHLLNIRTPDVRIPFSLSPDNRWLALTVSRVGRKEVNTPEAGSEFTPTGVSLEMANGAVVVVDTHSGDAFEPFPEDSQSWGAIWAPDGSCLAAYVQYEDKQACLGIWEYETKTYRLWHEIHVRPHFGFEVPHWFPDSRRLVVKLISDETPKRAHAQEKSTGPEGTTVKVLSYDPDNSAPEYEPEAGILSDFCDIGIVDVRSGSVDVLATGWRSRSWRVAPDGHAVAVMRMTGLDDIHQKNLVDLIVFPMDGTPPVTPAAQVRCQYGAAFSWSPDSKSIAFTDQAGAPPQRMYVVPADGSALPRDITGDEKTNLDWGDQLLDMPARWSPDGKRVYFAVPDGLRWFEVDGRAQHFVNLDGIDRRMQFWIQPAESPLMQLEGGCKVFVTTKHPDTGMEGIARLNVETGEATLLAEYDAAVSQTIFWNHAACDGSVYYLALETVDHPPEIYTIKPEQSAPQQFYTPNSILDDLTLGESRMFTWRDMTGRERLGPLMLPPGYREGEPVPTILMVYGDLFFSWYRNLFGFDTGLSNAHFLAGAGYAVLYPDMMPPDKDPMKHLAYQAVPAVTKLIDEGIADPERIGVMGHSYGGYTTLALLTQCPIFKAGISSCGIFNLFSSYRFDHGYLENGQGRMGGTPWDRREAYIENSPWFHLDRLTAPLLLLTGDGDQEAQDQAAEVFHALRRLGRRVDWRSYGGEGHSSWEQGAIPNMRDMGEAIIGWFDRYLKG